VVVLPLEEEGGHDDAVWGGLEEDVDVAEGGASMVGGVCGVDHCEHYCLGQ
jgi:hypothetical protein